MLRSFIQKRNLNLYRFTPSRQSERQLGMDLLKILLMFFIVMHHSLVHGLGFYDTGNSCYGYECFINSFVVVGVNCFFLISGFFTVKTSVSKVVKLHLSCVAYGLLSYAIFLIFNIEKFNLLLFVKTLVLPELFYWFMLVYFVILLLANFFDKLIDIMSFREYTLLLLILFGIESLNFITNSSVLGINYGYSVFHGIFMYFLGRYLFLYRYRNIKNGVFLAVYFFIAIINCFILILLSGYNIISSSSYFAYSNPLIVMQSVALFVFVRNLRISNKGVIANISKLSFCTLPVYLLSDHMGVNKWIFSFMSMLMMNQTSIQQIFTLIIFDIILFVFCMLIGFMIESIFSAFFQYLSRRRK